MNCTGDIHIINQLKEKLKNTILGNSAIAVYVILYYAFSDMILKSTLFSDIIIPIYNIQLVSENIATFRKIVRYSIENEIPLIDHVLKYTTNKKIKKFLPYLPNFREKISDYMVSLGYLENLKNIYQETKGYCHHDCFLVDPEKKIRIDIMTNFGSPYSNDSSFLRYFSVPIIWGHKGSTLIPFLENAIDEIDENNEGDMSDFWKDSRIVKICHLKGLLEEIKSKCIEYPNAYWYSDNIECAKPENVRDFVRIGNINGLKFSQEFSKYHTIRE